MIYMSICPKCANFKVNATCKFCKVKTIEVDVTIEESMKMTDRQEEELINHYIETLIKDTYDPKAREYREANQEYVFAHYVHESQITCPTCHSTNVQKIGTGERVASVGLFGMFSNKINKSFKCKSCGYTW